MRPLFLAGLMLVIVSVTPAWAQTQQAPDPNVALTPGAPPPPPPTADPNIHWSTDAMISARLYQKLNTGPYGAQISVNTERGQVLLSGIAASAEASVQAEQLARQEPGVVAVRNALIVQPGPPPPAPNMVPETGDTPITPPVPTPPTAPQSQP